MVYPYAAKSSGLSRALLGMIGAALGSGFELAATCILTPTGVDLDPFRT